MLQRKPANRLGLRGAVEIKTHPWFKNYPFDELLNKTIESPFKPKVGDNFDRKYCEAPEKLGNNTRERYENYMKDEDFNKVFRVFTYVNKQEDNDNNSRKVLIKSATLDKTQPVKPKVKINSNYNSSNRYNSLRDKKIIGQFSSSILIEDKFNNTNLKKSNNNLSINDKLPNIDSKIAKLKKITNTYSANNLLKNISTSSLMSSQRNAVSPYNFINKK